MNIKLPFRSMPLPGGTSPEPAARPTGPAARSSAWSPSGLLPRLDAARHAANMSTAPRNSRLPPMPAAQAALNIAAFMGGDAGKAAYLASAALNGAVGAPSLTHAAFGAATSMAHAAIRPGTPLAGAFKLAQLSAGVIGGTISPRKGMVQGVGTALQIAAGLMPGPLGQAAKVSSAAVFGMAGATTAAGALGGAALAGASAMQYTSLGRFAKTAAAGAAIGLAGAAGAPTWKSAAFGAAASVADAALYSAGPAGHLARIGIGVMRGSIEPRNAMTLGIGASLDMAGWMMPGALGAAALFASAGYKAYNAS